MTAYQIGIDFAIIEVFKATVIMCASSNLSFTLLKSLNQACHQSIFPSYSRQFIRTKDLITSLKKTTKRRLNEKRIVSVLCTFDFSWFYVHQIHYWCWSDKSSPHIANYDCTNDLAQCQYTARPYRCSVLDIDTIRTLLSWLLCLQVWVTAFHGI